jgi:nucleotide-binding universal stress UspA family protein
MKILLAVDGSPYTQRMLDYICAHGDWLGPRHEYDVLTVMLPVPHRAASFVGADAVRRYHEEDAQAVLAPIKAFLDGNRIPATYRWLVGHPSTVIATEAEKGRHDLVMMGSHGHGEFAAAVLGSVATQVLGRCRTPVLLVR